jgi:imidazole glycerol phosphate synthase glutamine amidotransferase subunit
VKRALRQLGAEVLVTNCPEDIARADRLILPGVGHCGALIAALDARALREPLLIAIASGVHFLGICLGLQALYEASDEAPQLSSLGIVRGRVTHLPPEVKLPHMGWNQLGPARASQLLNDIPRNAYFYFAHSYAPPAVGEEIAAACHHGRDFAAVVEHNNIFGVQFHPEKSGAPGAKLLENFLRVSA